MTNDSSSSTSLRLWPGVAAVVVTIAVRFGLPTVFPEALIVGLDSGLVGLLGSVMGTIAIILWWLFFSRAPWAERLGAIVMMAIAVIIVKAVSHPSITGAGMGMLLYIHAIPVMGLALVAWAAATRGLGAGPRRLTMVVAILLAGGLFALLRTDGVTSNNTLGSDFRWRWTPTAEELTSREEWRNRGRCRPRHLPSSLQSFYQRPPS